MNDKQYIKIKLKYVAEIFNGNSISDDEKDSFTNRQIPYIPTKEIDAESHKINYQNGLSVNPEDGFKIAPSGSTLMCIEGGSAGKKIAFLERDVAFVNKLCCFKPISIDPLCLYFALQSKFFLDQFRLNISGLIGGVSINTIKNLEINVPADALKQRLEAQLVSQKTNSLDELIRIQQDELKDFDEYRLCTITHAVLGGINKASHVKASSIEWVNEIPLTWSESKLGNKAWVRARLGWKGLKADEYLENGYPFLSAFNIVDNAMSWESLNFISQQRYDESPEIKLKPGDLILVKDGAGIGKCARIDALPHGDSTTNSSLAVITPHQDLNYRYLNYYFQSTVFQNLILRVRNGMGVPHLTQEEIKNIIVPIPPSDVQEEIANYLDSFTSKISELKSIKTKKIQHLKLLRAALIDANYPGEA